MSDSENAGPVKAPKACFEEPSNVSIKSDYYRDFCLKMKADDHYTLIVTKIDAGIVTIDKFDTAILEALSGLHGKVLDRNNAETTMKYAMDSLLQNVQDVCNTDPVGAKAHLQSLGISWYSRETYTKDDIDIRHGKVSGSFDLLVRQPKGEFAVVWFITTDPTDEKSWVMADFSHNTHGFIDGLVKATILLFQGKGFIVSRRKKRLDKGYRYRLPLRIIISPFKLTAVETINSSFFYACFIFIVVSGFLVKQWISYQNSGYSDRKAEILAKQWIFYQNNGYSTKTVDVLAKQRISYQNSGCSAKTVDVLAGKWMF